MVQTVVSTCLRAVSMPAKTRSKCGRLCGVVHTIYTPVLNTTYKEYNSQLPATEKNGCTADECKATQCKH